MKVFNVSREQQIKQDREKADNAKSEIFDQSVEIGKKIGQLDKDEERIKELSKEIENKDNQIKSLNNKINFFIFMICLGFFAFIGVFIYIFLDKYGFISSVINNNFESNVKIIDTSIVEENPSKVLKTDGEQKSKALLAEKPKD